MYLKKLELHGFKSFADKRVITFEEGMTGIVGPNGCGKSNITDAIRWVLGEQSVKSLRGSAMSDVIFKGSEDRKAHNLAEVTLIFDNSDNRVNLPYNEIEITRRIYRANNEAEYFLNKEKCRLKDINDILLDTGLGKDSLSIISQGNITSFAEAKPIERRGIFEEAAGVSKYKKRKLEAIRKLERTNDNLERIEDIVNELEKQIGPLRRQKNKAEKYIELKEQLTDVEINLLVHELTYLSQELATANKKTNELKQKTTQIDADIILNENKYDEVREKSRALDIEINQLQDKILEAADEVTRLQSAKEISDANHQHLLNNSSIDDIQTKIASLKTLLTDSLAEYNDREKRLVESKKKTQDLINTKEDLRIKIENIRTQIANINHQISNSKSRKQMLVDDIENKNSYGYGTKTILKTQSNNPNIYGVVNDLIEVDEEYAIAISTALGFSGQHIVTKDDQAAKDAIYFLKKNKSGRATFLPTNILKPRFIRDEHQLVLDNSQGYLGVASDFISFEDKINNVIKNLLGNILIVDNLENASVIAKSLYNRYRIVTLSGDVINVGGSLTGGSASKSQSTLLAKHELSKLSDEITNNENTLRELNHEFSKIDNEFKEVNETLLQTQLSTTRLQVVVENKKDELVKYKADYEKLSNESIELKDFEAKTKENETLIELNNAIERKDALISQIQQKRTLNSNYHNDSADFESKLRILRADYKQFNKELNDSQVLIARYETDMNNHLTRLNEEYSMTFEYAQENYNQEIDLKESREIVVDLRGQISKLGNVNLDAIEEYMAVSSRYEDMNNQRLDLVSAQDSILKAIEDMDTIMINQFSETVEKINVEFNNVFRKLFGGGSASISFTEPDNILETGIDIDVQPPGKQLGSSNLLSGGEKTLIAISCLFAILRVNPVPMVILDEVEAALDLANVDRFAKYLKEFSKISQFIVVTHREGTMEQCDLLYGATMQQKGVTKLVSVKLEDAVDLTESTN